MGLKKEWISNQIWKDQIKLNNTIKLSNKLMMMRQMNQIQCIMVHIRATDMMMNQNVYNSREILDQITEETKPPWGQAMKSNNKKH